MRPAAILGKAVSNVETFDGDASAQDRFDKAFNQAVGLEYSLGKTYQTLDELNGFYAAAEGRAGRIRRLIGAGCRN